MKIARSRLGASLGLALLVLVLTGCAVLFDPNPQSVPVVSDPEGAQVLVDGTLIGTAPIVLELDGRRNHEVVVRWQGQERRIALESTISGAFVTLDVLPGLAIAGVSYALGSAWSEGYVDSFSEFVVVTGSGIGVIVGVGSAMLNFIVDASTGRWRQLSPTTIAVTFE